MRTSSTLPVLLIAGSISVGVLLADESRDQAAHTAPKAAEPVVTAVAGPSWLNHLNLRSEDSSLGRGAGRYGPPPTETGPSTRRSSSSPTPRSTVLTGADLYRLNCQACHRAEGTGAPPEIKSVLSLVQGSSFQWLRQQLKQEGKAGSIPALQAQATKARTELYRRIREGGQRMPPLQHLDAADIDALYSYLGELASAKVSIPFSSPHVTWTRLGEHVVKGTCHICHDADGARPSPESMLQGAIPPLTMLVADNAQVGFIQKTLEGAPVTMGRLSLHYRGRMPVFYYLRDEEVAAAYDFLVAYPPRLR
jgi:mono/diheme cytochrome c family protein